MSEQNAVIYVRVSSEEQTHNLSLATQEKQCREYCARNGWAVVQVFTDAGESAKTAKRPALIQMTEYCRKNGGRVSYAVVYSLSRFARNTLDHHTVQARLAGYGVSLRSVTEPIDESSSGKLMGGILASFAQFDNNVRSERTIAGMSAAAQQGRWTHKPPIGYRFEGVGPDSRLVPDPERAPFITRAFELFATGIHSATEVLAILSREGFRTTNGKMVAGQTFYALLRNPIYTGWIIERGVRYRGAFPALVDEGTFARVQAMRSESRTGATRKRHNPEFPLKGTVLCGYCRHPLTGSNSTGRNAERYGYYTCFAEGCAKVKVRREILESDFLRFLASIQPKPPFVRLFRDIVLDRWRETNESVDRELRAVEKTIVELEAKQVKLVDLLVTERLTQEMFDASARKIEEDLRHARMSQRDLRVDKIDVEAILDFGEALLVSVGSMWMEATPQQKERIQRVVLPRGVPYANGVFGNAELLSVFSYLREIESTQQSLASPTGFEPVSPP